MGAIHRGIPQQLALQLARAHGLKYFVETGTFTGRTANWAASNFNKVATIELSLKWYSYAKPTLRNGITHILGDSAKELPKALASMPGPALVWLDAHWSPDLKYTRPETECPVLAEIEAIIRDGRSHVVMIDDARYFLAPPPEPHKGWPGYDEIKAALGPGWALQIREDVIIAEMERK